MKKLLGAIVAIAASALANLAMAADLRMPVKAVPPGFAPPPAFDWTGFYIGVNAGGSIGRDPTDVTAVTVPGGTFSHEASFTESPAGFAGGGQIGYNWQLAPTWVFGVEADFQGTSQKDTATVTSVVEFPSTLTTTHKLDWFATARARLGYTNGDWLWYVTGGGAWGRITQDFTETEPTGMVDAAVSGRHTKAGFTVGGGVETHLWGRWTAKVEYLFVDLGHISDSAFDAPDSVLFTSTSKIEDHIIRAGINYKF
jgi:outer membrane immunogenic protein